MPIFRYGCKDCKENFELLVFSSTKLECPKCKGQNLEKQLSVFAVGSSAKLPTCDLSACGSCGESESCDVPAPTPGPGCCGH